MSTRPYSAMGQLLLESMGQRGQEEIASRIGVSQGAFSRWVTGTSRPSARHLGQLAIELNRDAHELAAAARHDGDTVARFAGRYLRSRYRDLDEAERFLAWCYQARINGDPNLALEIAAHLTEWLVPLTQWDGPPRAMEPMLLLASRALYESAIAIEETTSRSNITDRATPISRQLHEIAKYCRCSEPSGLVYSIVGNAHYTQELHSKAVHELEMAVDMLKRPDQRLWAVRALILSRAYLRDRTGFHKAERIALRIIESGRFTEAALEHVVHTMEGIGRGQGLLGMPQALDTLEAATKLYDSVVAAGVRAPIRPVQMARSRLEVIRLQHPRDVGLIEQVGQEGLKAARQFGYVRHGGIIEQILQERLN